MEGEPVRVMGMRMPVRMTVIRLRSGELWLHSPTPSSEALKHSLEAIGPVGRLVAPDVAHWSLVKDWQQHVSAVTWAAPNLRRPCPVRRSGVRFDHYLGEHPPEAWANDLEQAIIWAGGGFREVAFFHRTTGTLVLTDLIVNLERQKLPLAAPHVCKANRDATPDGRAPAYLHLIVRIRRQRGGQCRPTAPRLGTGARDLHPRALVQSDGAAALRLNRVLGSVEIRDSQVVAVVIRLPKGSSE